MILNKEEFQEKYNLTDKEMDRLVKIKEIFGGTVVNISPTRALTDKEIDQLRRILRSVDL